MKTEINPVSKEAQENLDLLIDMAQAGDSGLALVSSNLDGTTPVDVIVGIAEREDGSFHIAPIAIMVTEENGLFDRLTDPAAEQADA